MFLIIIFDYFYYLVFMKYCAIVVNMFYFKRTLGLIIGTGLVCTIGTPAYGIDFQSSNQVEVQEVKTDSPKAPAQSMVVSTKIEEQVAARDSFTVMTHEELVADVTSSKIDVSSIPGNAGLLGAAMAQIGVYEDCTAMVENALRALGYEVADLGPMQFGQYGVQVDPSQIQPGDIMMRPGHVAIYAGDGMAVHGGFGWKNGVTYTTWDSDPYSYAQIIRV